MQIKKMAVADLKPAVYNPRKTLKPGDPEWIKLEKSLIEFGYVDPVIVNMHPGREGIVIGGHQRLAVLAHQGVERIEVSIVSLPEEKEKLLSLALNKIGEGNWDTDKLATLLAGLQEIPAIDMDLTGFNTKEIMKLMPLNLDPGPPPPPPDEVKTRLIRCPKCGHEFH